MTREQASEVIAMTLDQIATQIMDAGEIDAETKQGLRLTIEAFTMARTALRSGWVRTADRLPTEADAGYNEEVVTLYRDSDTELAGCDYWKYVAKNPECFPYWMPMPKLPEVEG